MDIIVQILAFLAVVAGTLFSVLGVLGYMRLPDIYSRLHTVGKVGAFGAVLLLVGALVWTPLGLGKGLLLIVLLLLAGPVTAHTLASAAYRVGIPQSQALRDDLAQAVEQSHPSVEKNLG